MMMQMVGVGSPPRPWGAAPEAAARAVVPRFTPTPVGSRLQKHDKKRFRDLVKYRVVLAACHAAQPNLG